MLDMSSTNPKIVILAGPNGAGKSTAAPDILKGALRVGEFVNADVIARGLSGFLPEEVSLQAGRAMLHRIHQLASEKRDFAFETTLASRSFKQMIERLKRQSSYSSYLVFLWLHSPELALARVRNRVKMGGHNVSEEIVRRRYKSGLRNFFTLYLPVMDSWYLYDNSSENKSVLIAKGCRTEVSHVTAPEIWKKLKEQYYD
ncbi:MAG: AAA family ATPase [Candidatus Hatepunaea meridiana]|nr:AAA family ATPase [Candidatus Hatepunaea meridiana]